MTAAQARAGSPVLRMVPGMGSIFRDTPRPPAKRTEVTDWLSGPGGVALAIAAMVIVVWGVVSQVTG